VLASSLAQAEDAAHSLHGYLRKTEARSAAPGRAGRTHGLWMSLARRYKRTPAELPALLAGWKAELQALDAQSRPRRAWKRAEQNAQQAYLAEAKALGKARKQAAPALAKAVTQAMQGLGMQGGRFEVALQPLAQPSRAGLEDSRLPRGRPCRQHPARRSARWPRAASCRASRWPSP
jgi:DNA repair protein RecN (Recombination protein N)